MCESQGSALTLNFVTLLSSASSVVKQKVVVLEPNAILSCCNFNFKEWFVKEFKNSPSSVKDLGKGAVK